MFFPQANAATPVGGAKTASAVGFESKQPEAVGESKDKGKGKAKAKEPAAAATPKPAEVEEKGSLCAASYRGRLITCSFSGCQSHRLSRRTHHKGGAPPGGRQALRRSRCVLCDAFYRLL